jgi:hypothetical protein
MFFNSVNPASNPELFFQFLTELAAEASALKGKVVVNTCGWVEGLGAEILLQFAKKMDRPSTQFIYLESPTKICEVDLSVLGVWLTTIKGDVRFPTSTLGIAKQSSKASDNVI